MGSKSFSSSKTYSTTKQLDERNFAEGGSAVAGQGSSISYPSSISVFGSPESQVGDITFISHAPAENSGIGDQLSGIMAAISTPAPTPAFAPAIPMPAARSGAAAYTNYIIIAAFAAGAFLLLKGI